MPRPYPRPARLRSPRPGGFAPQLVELEGRDCPSLTIGPNINVTQRFDHQNNPTVAIDPSDPTKVFTANMTWDAGHDDHGPHHAGYLNPLGNGRGIEVRSNAVGVASRATADGSPFGDALPGVYGLNSRPHAAYDQYGNLFMAYNSGDQMNRGSGTIGAYTLHVPGANWTPGQWVGQRAHVYESYNMSDTKPIVASTKDTVTVASDWEVPYFMDPDVKFIIGTPHMGGSSVTLAVSTDHGASFRWLKTFEMSLSSDYDAYKSPLVATGPGANGKDGSVWVGWFVSAGPHAWGASVTGKGQFGSFVKPTAPTYPYQGGPGNGQGFGGGGLVQGLSVGPTGQVMISVQGQYRGPYNTVPPPPGGGYPGGGYVLGEYEVWTAVAPSGPVAGAAFGQLTKAAETWVSRSYQIPPRLGSAVFGNPDYAIVDANARLAYDRSGAHPGRVYMAYLDAAADGSTDTNVLVKFSDNNGTSWSNPIRVNDDAGKASQHLPELAVDQTTGHLAVTWLDPRNDPGNETVKLYATVSQNGGLSFEGSVPVSTGASDGTIANAHQYGTATWVGSDGKSLGDVTKNWRPDQWAGIDLYDPYGRDPSFPYEAGAIGSTYGSSYQYGRTIANTKDSLALSKYFYFETPPTGTVQYTVGPLFRQTTGEYTGLAFHAGKFYALWADNSNSTVDNPDIIGYQQITFDLYSSAVTVVPESPPTPPPSPPTSPPPTSPPPTSPPPTSPPPTSPPPTSPPPTSPPPTSPPYPPPPYPGGGGGYGGGGGGYLRSGASTDFGRPTKGITDPIAGDGSSDSSTSAVSVLTGRLESVEPTRTDTGEPALADPASVAWGWPSPADPAFEEDELMTLSGVHTG